MGHYFVEGSFTAAAAKSLVAAPGDRSVVAKTLVESMGGTFHSYFFTFGDSDDIVLAEFPDDTAAMATGIALGASGAFSKSKVTKLMTRSEAQAAMTRAQDAKYAAPAS